MNNISELNESPQLSGADAASCHKQKLLQEATPQYKHAALTLNGTTFCNKTNKSANSCGPV